MQKCNPKAICKDPNLFILALTSLWLRGVYITLPKLLWSAPRDSKPSGTTYKRMLYISPSTHITMFDGHYICLRVWLVFRSRASFMFYGNVCSLFRHVRLVLPRFSTCVVFATCVATLPDMYLHSLGRIKISLMFWGFNFGNDFEEFPSSGGSQLKSHHMCAYCMCQISCEPQTHKKSKITNFSELGVPGGQTLSRPCGNIWHHITASQRPYNEISETCPKIRKCIYSRTCINLFLYMYKFLTNPFEVPCGPWGPRTKFGNYMYDVITTCPSSDPLRRCNSNRRVITTFPSM